MLYACRVAKREDQLVVGKCPSCTNLWRLVAEPGTSEADCPQCHTTIEVKPYLDGFLFVQKQAWDPSYKPTPKALREDDYEGY